jgi:hypothetical protein
MIRKTFILSFFALLFFGCGNSQKKIKYEKDSVKLKQDFLPGVAGSPAPPPSLKDKIQGVWTDGSDVNASLLISGDTVVFIEQPPYKYELGNDSIKIFYPDHAYKAKLFFKNDTLIMDEGGAEGLIKYWAFKD